MSARAWLSRRPPWNAPVDAQDWFGRDEREGCKEEEEKCAASAAAKSACPRAKSSRGVWLVFTDGSLSRLVSLSGLDY